MAQHFTAVLSVTSTTTVEPERNDRGYKVDNSATSRIVDKEVEKMVVRANSLADLQRKLAARVALIEE